MANKNKLSIYLIREASSEEDVIKDYNKFKSSEIDDDIYSRKMIVFSDNKKAFYLSSRENRPNWITSFFEDDKRIVNLYTSNSKLVLLVKVLCPITKVERIFAVTMGHGKSLINENLIEDNFGLKVLLNCIDKDSIRQIYRTNIGGNLKTSNEQLPLTGSIAEFDVDINRDLVTNITAQINNNPWFKGMSKGADILNVSAEADLTNIESLLKYCLEKYHDQKYKENFSWIDNISNVKDAKLCMELDSKMLDSIKNNGKEFWLAVPEIIDWANVNGFKIAGYDKELKDLKMEYLLQSFKKNIESCNQLKNKKISIIPVAEEGFVHQWNSYRCIFGELDYNGKSYCINNGKWYCIDKDFKDSVIKDYDLTSISAIEFDVFEHENENAYSSDFCTKHTNYLCLDKDTISYGGGHSSIELCDILSSTNELIHLKPYGGSSTLSHLFNQGLVSIDLIRHDDDFFTKVNEKIKERDINYVITDENRKHMKVVYGIIQSEGENLPHIPFFSKVALKHVKKQMKDMNVSLEIKRIIKRDKCSQKILSD